MKKLFLLCILLLLILCHYIYASLNSDLDCAIRENDINKIKKIFKEKIDINVKLHGCYTPLTYACKLGHIEIVRLLIANGANVNKTIKYRVCLGIWNQEESFSALTKAACGDYICDGGGYQGGGNIDIVKLLIKNGAIINITNSNPYNMLKGCADRGHTEIIKLLIKNNVDVDKFGKEALLNACSRGYFDIVKILVEKGVDVNFKDKYNDTPLVGATRSSNIKIINYLIDKGLEIKSNNPQKAMCIAAFSGYIDIVKLLVKNGININFKSLNYKKGQSPISLAITAGHINLINFLINNGATIDPEDKYIKRAFLLAGRTGNIDVIKLLLRNGVDVNTISVNLRDLSQHKGTTALFNASIKGNVEIVKLLIKSGANIDVEVIEGYYKNRTPLIGAASEGNLEVVKLLVKNKANIHPQDRSVLALPSLYGHFDVVKYLIEKGADVNANKGEALWMAATNGHIQIIKLLIESGIDVKKYGKPALKKALKRGFSDIVDVLKKAGVEE